MVSGRAPGYKHSEQTKNKIRQSLLGRPHPSERKNNISKGKALYDLDGKCLRRFQELRATYPEQQDFFDENEADLIFAMKDIRSEQELDYIRRNIENIRLQPDEPYQYSSSSCFAAEDAMIELLDIKRFLQKFH